MSYTTEDLLAMVKDPKLTREDIRNLLVEDFKKECEEKFDKSNESADP